MWNSGNVSNYTTDLWTAGTVTPLDEGLREEEITGHKIRPIILCECLVKFSEGIEIEEEWEEIGKYMEGNSNLGVGTPDGNVIILRMLQTWVEEAEVGNQADYVEGKFEELSGFEKRL